MSASDERFEKPLFQIRDGLMDLAQWGTDQGLTTPERFRLTREARKEEVRMLANAGMPQRQIAKAVGVERSTVQRDLGARKAPQNEAKSATPIEDLRRIFLMRADQAHGFADACKKMIPTISEANASDRKRFASAASATAKAWTTLARELGAK
jgi:hypothetical protein